jgi:VanZ family protein
VAGPESSKSVAWPSLEREMLTDASRSVVERARLWCWRFRWPIWSGYAVAWSLALLTPQPVAVCDAVFAPDTGHLASKTLHISSYAVFTILSAWLRARLPWRWLLLAFLSLHGFLTEYLQHFVPTRTPSWGDVGLDHLGILIGLLVAWKWWRQPAPSETITCIPEEPTNPIVDNDSDQNRKDEAPRSGGELVRGQH